MNINKTQVDGGRDIPMTTDFPAVPALNRDCKRLLPKTKISLARHPFPA